MGSALSFRWLGVAGIELQVNGRVLAIDPFFLRPPFWRVWFGRVSTDPLLSAQKLPHCDWILVTHAHYDHLMDVPDIARRTGARGYGSPNACRLLRICGVPEEQIRQVQAGDTLTLGEFQVEVLPARHVSVPGFEPGPLAQKLYPPLRLRQYRMDDCFNFYIQVAGLRLLVCSDRRPDHARPAEVLFTSMAGPDDYYQAVLEIARPQLVIPIHWDNLFRPLSRPIRPYYKPPSLTFPPLQTMDPAEFKRRIERSAPSVRVLVPEIFQRYDLTGLACPGQLIPKTNAQIAGGQDHI